MLIKDNIGIFKIDYPCPSETFISEQARHLKQYIPFLLTIAKKGQIDVPYLALSDHDYGKIRQRWMFLTKSASFFIKNTQVKKLKLIHAHFGPGGIYALPIAHQLRIPLITTFHGFDVTVNNSDFLFSTDIASKHYLFGKHSLKKSGAAFIAVSNFIKDKLMEKGFPADRIIQHYIGVDTDKFSPANRPINDRYILSVGRHVDKKGIDVLLRAFALIADKHSDVTLVQVGAGPMTEQLHSLAEKLVISHRVKFLGSQPHETVLRLMQGAELFALPSQTALSGDSEALGIVFNEASACAIPIVSTMHGGIPEAVLHGETGLLAPEGNYETLAGYLDVLLSDMGMALQFGQRGRELVCDSFDIVKQTKKLEDIYEKVISEWKR